MRKFILFFTVLTLIAAILPGTALAAPLTVTKLGADNETAYLEWTGSAADYQVYIASAAGDYTLLDTELTRTYSGFYRADALGLAPGSYRFKIVPAAGEPVETETINVTAHTREGFAFSKNSPNRTASGGYADDGTVPTNAQILYITKDNLNTVTLDVYESSTKLKTCTGLNEILQYRGKGKDVRPLIIRVIGELDSRALGLTPGAYEYLFNSSGYMVLKGCSNITFEGVGNDATLDGFGLLIRNANNIEVRNLGIMMYYDDGVSIDTDNYNIWVHNNDFFYGYYTPGDDSDKVKGDGAADAKKSQYITMSYNHFFDNGKCNLLDATATNNADDQSNYLTYHHNWYDHSDSRHPRIRHASTHVYNNYFDGNAKYGVGVTSGASAFVENNYFRNCKHPMIASMQGTDVESPSLSDEAGGIIKAYNNAIIGGEDVIYYAQAPDSFDAYLAAERNERIPSNVVTKVNTYKSMTFANVYNNFDTDPNLMYNYTPDSPEDAAEKVKKYAGRIEGGDFKWKFNNDTEDRKSVV